MQRSEFQVPVTLAAQRMCVYIYIVSWVRLIAIPAILAFCLGKILNNTAGLALIFTDGTFIHPLALHKFAFGAAVTPLVLAELLVPLSLWWHRCVHRLVRVPGERLPAWTSQLPLQELTRLRRTLPWIVFPGCVGEAFGVWGNSHLVPTPNESWKADITEHLAPSTSFHSLFNWVQQKMRSVRQPVLAALEEMHFFSSYKHHIS